MCLEKDWENEMKIERICTTILKRPVEKKFGGSKYNYDVGGYLLTQVYADDGNIGCATTYFGLIESGMATVRKIIDEELSSVLVGEDPHFVRFLRRKMYSRIEYYGIMGVATMAISALDICLWDLVGKAAGVPTAMVLGASRKSVPAYAMVGWYFQDGLKGLVESCVNAAEEGFSAVKIKVGRGSLEDDLNRIKAIQSELGTSFRIMVDANCAFDEMEALRRGNAYQDLGVYWFEEPLQPFYKEGHRRLREKLRIPIAIGENFYTKYQFYDAIREGCVDIVQPDNRRAGGVTEWMEIGAIAEVSGLKVASHLGGSGNVNVMCALDNVIYLECEGIKRDNEMLRYPLKMVDGQILLPDVPGMGNELKADFIEKYKVC